MAKINLKMVASRFLVPNFLITAYYFFKYNARVSLSAEVELSNNITFGAGTNISSFTKLKATSGKLTIGKRGGVATGCFISAGEQGIDIGDNFICGPNVTIISSNYIHAEKGVHLEDQGHTSKGIKIGNNVWIGAGSTILDGSVIGDNTIIVANSLINRRYKPDAILQGNPAKVILNR